MKSALVSVPWLRSAPARYALVSIALARLTLVSVPLLRLAPVRFCPAKFQPVIPPYASPMPWRSLA